MNSKMLFIQENFEKLAEQQEILDNFRETVNDYTRKQRSGCFYDSAIFTTSGISLHISSHPEWTDPAWTWEEIEKIIATKQCICQ
jgi:hypothetical protein